MKISFLVSILGVISSFTLIWIMIIGSVQVSILSILSLVFFLSAWLFGSLFYAVAEDKEHIIGKK